MDVAITGDPRVPLHERFNERSYAGQKADSLVTIQGEVAAREWKVQRDVRWQGTVASQNCGLDNMM